jgi:hypothetical protein
VAVKTVAPDQPRTLMQAHEELVRVRPDRGASLAVWLEYYQRSVSLYERIARINPGHDGEALYWAQRERRRGDRIAAQLGKGESR